LLRQGEPSKAEQHLPFPGINEINGGLSPYVQDMSEDHSKVPNEDEPEEQHYTIFYGETGYSYESIVGPYLKVAKEITIEDPYIRVPYQIQNFVRFCETVVRLSPIRKITLITASDDSSNVAEMHDRLDELKQSLLELDIILDIKLNPNLHDREIHLDNGWVIKIGRGLDFYQKPNNWFEIGANDLSLRRCLETKVDIFKVAT
jgi:ATP-dependent Lon protease